MRWLKTKQVRNRVFFTLFILFLFEVGTFIPLPFVASTTGESGGMLANLLNMTSGGALSRFGLLALGIGPYITSSIIIQLLVKSISKLKKLQESGPEGRTKIAQYTRTFTLVLAFITALGFVFNPMLSSILKIAITANTTQKIILAIIMSIGALFTVWLGEQIDENGIGQGASVLIGFGILSGFPQQVYKLIKLYSIYKSSANLSEYWINLAIVFGIFVFMTLLCIWANRKEYKFAIQSKLNKYKIEAHYFPIKLLASSVMPVIIATSWMSVCSIVSTGLKKEWEWTKYTTPSGFIVYIILIFLFSFLYNYIQIDGEEIQKNFQEDDVYFIGYSNLETGKFINRKLWKITIKGAPILTLIAGIAIAVDLFIPVKFGLSFTGISLLIVVGVFQEVIHQIRGLTNKQNYKEIF